jgi:hypothetical protein
MDTQFIDAFADRFAITGQPEAQAIDPVIYPGMCALVPQILQPIDKWCLPVTRNVVPDFHIRPPRL